MYRQLIAPPPPFRSARSLHARRWPIPVVRFAISPATGRSRQLASRQMLGGDVPEQGHHRDRHDEHRPQRNAERRVRLHGAELVLSRALTTSAPWSSTRTAPAR